MSTSLKCAGDPGRALNDDSMNKPIALFSKNTNSQSAIYFTTENTFGLEKLALRDASDATIKPFVKRFNKLLSEKSQTELLILPLFMSPKKGTGVGHWTLIVVDYTKKRLEFWNSLQSSKETNMSERIISRILTDVSLAASLRIDKPPSKWRGKTIEPVPQQETIIIGD